ncbi:MAG: hypothetical protein K6A43_11575 [Treponema sp.]|nr:hypothetical protein [Treponema sp.]
MVLKKQIISLFIFLSCSKFFCIDNTAISQSNFWQTIVQQAFKNSPQVQASKNNYATALITKKQDDYSWFPTIQLDLQQNIRESRGDYFYIQNQNTDSKNTYIINPFVDISINQRLSGNGNINLSARYGFDYLIERNSFLQQPQIQLKYSQNLGKGTFNLINNPERKLLKEKIDYANLTYKKELITNLQSVIEKIGTFEILAAEEQYYKSLLEQYQSELFTAQEKNKNGIQSDLESYYALHQYSNTRNNLDKVTTNKNNAEKEIKLILPEITILQIEQNRTELTELIDKFLCFIEKDDSQFLFITEENLDTKLYRNYLHQQKIDFQINELNYVPVFYTSSSAKTNSNFYYNYSDWYKSFRNLTDYPYPLDFTLSAGIRLNLEVPKAKKLRKEIYELETATINKNYESNHKRQNEEILITKNKIQINKEYLEKLTAEILQEKDYRMKRKKLFEENIITQNEFYQSETMFFYIYKDYILTFWEFINNQIKIIALSSEYEQLIKIFLGEAPYEL